MHLEIAAAVLPRCNRRLKVSFLCPLRPNWFLPAHFQYLHLQKISLVQFLIIIAIIAFVFLAHPLVLKVARTCPFLA